jgi:hypothetical protein
MWLPTRTQQRIAGKAVDAEGKPLAADLVEQVPFLVLSMDLPPAPLYKDALERNIIPQVRCVLQCSGACPSQKSAHCFKGYTAVMKVSGL